MTNTRCGHCGRQATREHVKSLPLTERVEEIDYAGDRIEATFQTMLHVAICRVCGEPTLGTYHWVDPFSDPEDARIEIFYPPSRSIDDLPERVGARYLAMLELLHAPDAFAVRAGRLLETVCADRGIDRNRGDLNGRLDLLVQEGHLPPPLADQAHLVRQYRNLGGHDAEVEVEDDDVRLVRDFVEALLEFLYWGPAKLVRGADALRARRDRARARTSGSSSQPEPRSVT